MAGLAPVVWLDETDSTNAEARRRVQSGAAWASWIAARRQTAGVGRRGRTWNGGEGNLTATLLFSTDKSMAEAAGVAFVAALAVADLTQAAVPDVAVTLKWPNDVLLAARKVSGILVETTTASDGGLWVIVGVGMNLASAPPEMHPEAAAIADYSAPPTPDDALSYLAERMCDWLDLWKGEGMAPILAAWSARATGLPGPCTARLPAETVEGEAVGLDIDGALRLRLADGSVRRITAGDVFFGGA